MCVSASFSAKFQSRAFEVQTAVKVQTMFKQQSKNEVRRSQQPKATEVQKPRRLFCPLSILCEIKLSQKESLSFWLRIFIRIRVIQRAKLQSCKPQTNVQLYMVTVSV
jgi:hypothetical protein